jgi:hypothetical protein
MSGATVQLEVAIGSGKGTVGYPLGNIQQVVMAQPPEVATAITTFQAKDYTKALALTRPLVDKYKGLPTDWAKQLTGLLGDIYVALNDTAKAEASYTDFQRVYPGGSSAQAQVGIARLAALKKDFATVKQKLEPITTDALKQKSVSKDAAMAYSQAFYLLGQAKEADGDHVGALEDYLRTVTVFNQDRVAAESAQQRADALRKEYSITVP